MINDAKCVLIASERNLLLNNLFLKKINKHASPHLCGFEKWFFISEKSTLEYITRKSSKAEHAGEDDKINIHSKPLTLLLNSKKRL